VESDDDIRPLGGPALEVLDRLRQAIWISDIDAWRFRWANRAGVSFWNAATLEELVARHTEASETIRTTFFAVRERAARGEIVQLDHTAYPGGAPVRIQAFCSAYALPEGHVGLFIEAQRAAGVDPEVIRSSEAVRYAPLVVTTHALDGTTLAANALARRTLGYSFALRDVLEDPAEADALLREVRSAGHVSRDLALRTSKGARWFAVEARRIPDPVTGQEAVVLSAHDVTARRRAEAAKEELISVVSHELRTPLTAIRGALSLLSHGRETGDRQHEEELLAMASENSARLGRLLDDLLDVQKLGAGLLLLRRAPASLRALVDEAASLLTPMARTRGVRLCVTGSAEDALVNVDSERVLQVLTNLVSNAIKHSPAGGEVRVAVAVTRDRARVTVEDEGPGVPPSFRQRMFDRFTQADSSDARPIAGVGLGLYIAKMLVEHHGGQLSFDESREQGAAFSFELPREG
jgi:signal transduction histidine kinase